MVPEIRSALVARTGGRVYVCNLRPQLPETAGFTAEDHLRVVLDHGVPVDVMVAPASAAFPRGRPRRRRSGLPDGHLTFSACESWREVWPDPMAAGMTPQVWPRRSVC